MELDISEVKFSGVDKKKEIKLPEKLTVDLAYLVGVHIADGSMNIYRRKYQVDYFYNCTGHAINEREWYITTLLPLFEKLFNWRPRHFFGKNGSIFILFRSKAILNFYNKVMGLPLGKKSHIIYIPKIILNAPLPIKLACIQGIFDSDFSLTFKNKSGRVHDYPVIRFGVCSKPLVDDVADILSEVGFNYSKYYTNQFDKRINKRCEKFHVDVSGRNNLDKWFRLIGSRNPNNLTKYKLWQLQGYCPPRTNVLERQNMLKELLSAEGRI